MNAIETAVDTEPPPSSGETVLLVEDEQAIREVALRVLMKLGYRVLATDTPNEAIRLAEEQPEGINLLVTDVVMPEMNGRDLAARLHALYPDSKVLFMSGYTSDVLANDGILDVGVNFIQKPFLMKDLASAVRHALGRR